MESKNLHVSFGSVRIEIDHMQLLFYYKCEYSLVIRENVFDIKNVQFTEIFSNFLLKISRFFSLSSEKSGK